MKRFLSRDMGQLSVGCAPKTGRGVSHCILLIGVFATLILFIGSATLRAGQKGGNGGTATKSAFARIFASPADREKPGSGWLYVLDSNNNKSESQVLLVDPEKGRVIRTFKASHVPDMALSPDGKRLYIASTLFSSTGYGHEVLEVINTASGAVLQTVDNPDRWVSTLPQYPSHMAISPDGRWLYSYKYHQISDEVFSYVATFDTVQLRFLTEKAPLPYCGGAAALLPFSDQRLNVICYDTADVRFLELTKSGAAVPFTTSDKGLPSKLSLWPRGVAEHSRRVGPGFLSADGNMLTVILGDGRFFRIDKESRKIMQTDAIDTEARKITTTAVKNTINAIDDWLADSWIRYQAPTLSPDGTMLYVGVGRLIHLRQGVQSFDRIMAFDSQTLKRVGTIKTSHPFFSLTLSKDGSRLFAISPEQASVMVIDTATQREVRTIYGIGTSPIRAIVAP